MEHSNVIPIALSPVVSIAGDRVVTTSLDVANFFEKEHFHVLRDIKNLDVPQEFNVSNFEAVEYRDAKGEMRPMYNITRDGFAILGMGFTGKKAMKFKLAYIEAFNRMEVELRKRIDQRRYNPALIARDIQNLLPKGFMVLTRDEWKGDMRVNRQVGAMTARSLSRRQRSLMDKAIEYREKGLTHAEIGKLLDVSAAFIERVLVKAYHMGKEVLS